MKTKTPNHTWIFITLTLLVLGLSLLLLWGEHWSLESFMVLGILLVVSFFVGLGVSFWTTPVDKDSKTK